jgi:hypothetical protein
MSDFKVTVRNNGPLRLEGAITIQTRREGGAASRTVVRCRCGQSAKAVCRIARGTLRSLQAAELHRPAKADDAPGSCLAGLWRSRAGLRKTPDG